MKTILFTALALFVLGACDTIDTSDMSCGFAEGRCLEQCRASPGAGQMACEDRCRAEADMCRARERR